MVNVRRVVVLILAAPFVTALLVFSLPQIARADFEAPPLPPPDIYATHAGVVLQNSTSTNQIDGAELATLDTSWTIETNWIDYDVPSDRTAWAMFYGLEGALVGAPQEGVNFAIVHLVFFEVLVLKI